MTLSARLDALVSIVETGVLPLFFSDDADRARRITDALRQGGARAIELTDRGPGFPNGCLIGVNICVFLAFSQDAREVDGFQPRAARDRRRRHSTRISPNRSSSRIAR